ncbi:hypothetical protein TWF481_009770 [Arthrobotrys musiformis]|uniref:Nephrocystin 3-like N-terminal domain-containing protein n=1 Tax=Arthrobotrys musiformis TaxID=47236 RepID=A0AAV9W4R3_9PEZI
MPNLDYTVGWICAISTEYVAAQAFLDEEHEIPEYVSTNDNNIYTLGMMGKHKVVIAVLPKGEYGIAAAASVARDMLHSFPNIRIGLMVGIGGGAPSQRHDIRLGDIVVSAPRDGTSGLFQYDFGKTIQDQTFQTTGHLDKPPSLLRAAVNDIEAQYERKGHKLEETIAGILRKWPKLRKKYKRPDLNSDRLYQSHITHPSDDERSCAAICKDNPSKLILRSDRNDDEDNPAIHYGLIASANQLMKDALIRDMLAAEKDVLCFEMEAAGLMNHFPCLVIRGICDYSDSHKNKEWQGYAAMTAAAYAKDLLSRIPSNKVEAEKKIGELISGVLGSLSKTEADVKTIRSNLEKKEDIEILNWLTDIDYGPQQTDYINRRQVGTGQWLLDSVEFQEWMRNDKQTLFCPGIPGAGKTILASIVVDYLSSNLYDTNVGIAYIYCNVRQKDTQKVNHLVASLIKQLAEGQSSLSGNIKDLYNRHKPKHTQPSLDELSSVLRSVAGTYSRAFIVVDALDECQTSNGCRKRFLSEIFHLQSEYRVNIFATSRTIPEVTEIFKNSTSLEIRARDEDIQKYIEGRILGEGLELLEKLHDEIKWVIIRVVDGMQVLCAITVPVEYSIG